MSIQLINTRKRYGPDIPICQTHCEMFDTTTGKCGIFDNEVPHDPLFTANCSSFLSKEEWQEHIEEMKEVEETINRYPLKPNISVRSDAVWYISSDKSFGCWIISLSKRNRFMLANTDSIDKGWHEEVYRSPYPLHNHDCSPEDAIELAWVIDEDGYGQYAYLDDGEIDYFHPKHS